MENLQQISDKDLYRKCQEFGSLSLGYRRKFCGLLPEVNRRQLHRKYGFHSIHEFASKLAGLSNDGVDKILHLDKKFQDKPILREKLQSGEIGYSKLRIVADIATSQNQNMWVQKAEQMSKATLETFVRGIKELHENQKDEFQNEKCRGKATIQVEDDNKNASQQNCPGAVIPSGQSSYEMSNVQNTLNDEENNENELFPVSFKLSRQMKAKLEAFRLKLERERGKTLLWEDVFEQLLEGKKPEAQTARKRKALPQPAITPQITSRHIPATIKREVEQRSEGICEYPHCFKPAENFHHTERFALSGKHTNIRNLCKAHHEIAHQGLIAAEEREPAEWKLQFFPDILEPKFEVDRAMRNFFHFR